MSQQSQLSATSDDSTIVQEQPEVESTLLGGAVLYGAAILICALLFYAYPRKLMFLSLPIVFNWLVGPTVIFCLLVCMFQKQVRPLAGMSTIGWIAATGAFAWYLTGEIIIYIT